LVEVGEERAGEGVGKPEPSGREAMLSLIAVKNEPRTRNFTAEGYTDGG
jgi:hypothetical protein